MEHFEAIFKIIEFILAPCFVWIIFKMDKLDVKFEKTKDHFTNSIASLREEMLKDYATKHELLSNIDILNTSISKLTDKIDTFTKTIIDVLKVRNK